VHKSYAGNFIFLAGQKLHITVNWIIPDLDHNLLQRFIPTKMFITNLVKGPKSHKSTNKIDPQR